MANDYHDAHKVVKGDPRVDGPYLDDVRADQERAYREHRNLNVNVEDPVALFDLDDEEEEEEEEEESSDDE